MPPNTKPAALVLSPEVPYPPVGGGALRTASLIEWLARYYDVDLVAFAEPDRPQSLAAVPRHLVRDIGVVTLPRHSKVLASRALRNLNRYIRRVPPLNDRFSGLDRKVSDALQGRHYTLAVIEHFWCVSYHPLLARHADAVVLDLHNIESVLARRCAASCGGITRILHGTFAGACLRLEREFLPRFSALLLTSERDRLAALDISPASHTIVFPNAIPLVPLPNREQRMELVFSGTLGYHPNIAAVEFFRRHIWPRLRERFPALRWRLVGREPEAVASIVRGDPRIELTGPVEDAIPVLAESQIAVIPVLAGSGTRVKILEAWAAGLPVVSTTIGAEGLDTVDGKHLLIADTASAFVNAVVNLLASAELRVALGSAGRVLYEESYSWPAVWRMLEENGHLLRPAS